MFASLKDNYTSREIEMQSLVYYGTCPCNSDILCKNSNFFSPSICPPNSNVGFMPLEELIESSCVEFVSPSIATVSTAVSHETPLSSYSRQNSAMDVPHFVLSTRSDALSSMRTTKPLNRCDDPGYGSAYIGQNITCFESKLEWRDLLDEMPRLCGEGNYNKTWLDSMRNAKKSGNHHVYYYGICPCKCATSCSTSSLFAYKKQCLWDGNVIAIEFSSSKSKPDLKTTFIHGKYTASRHFSFPTKFYDRREISSTAEPKFTLPNTLHSTLFTMVESALSSKKATKTLAGSKQTPASERSIALPEKDLTVSKQRFAQTTNPRSSLETLNESAKDPAYISMAASIESTPNEDDDENEPALVSSEGSSTSMTTIRTSKQDWHGVLTTILRTERQGFSTSKQNFSSTTFSKSYPTEATTTKNFSETPTDHTALRKDVKTSNYNHVYESSNHSTTYENLNTTTSSVSPTEKQETAATAVHTPIQKTLSSNVAVPRTIPTSSKKVNKAMTNTLRDEAASTSSSDSDANLITSEETEYEEVTHSMPTIRTYAETKNSLPKKSLSTNKKSSAEFVTATKPEPAVHASSANIETTDGERGDTSQMTSRTLESSQESSLSPASEYLKSSTYSTELITDGATTSTFSPKPRMSSVASSSNVSSNKQNAHMGSSASYTSNSISSDLKSSESLSISRVKSTPLSTQHRLSAHSSNIARAVTASRSSASSRTAEHSNYTKATDAEGETSVISTTIEMAESKSQRMMEMDFTKNSFEPTDSSLAETSQTASATYRDRIELPTTANLEGGQLTETFAYTPETAAESSEREISAMPQIGFTIPGISQAETSVNSTASGMVESESQRMMEMVIESSFEPIDNSVAETSQTASATYRDRIELSTTAKLKGGPLTETFAYTPETTAANSKREISAMPQIGFTIPDMSVGGTAAISTTFEMAESDNSESEMMAMDFTGSSSEFFGASSTEATLTSTRSAFASNEQSPEFTNSAESEHKTTSLQSAITSTVIDYREANTKIANNAEINTNLIFTSTPF
ncbi:unnamed protein product [Cylicostephanus goldi]|uniref:Uncharacterized protein n=1 Tax=Cylicostephanus goldi TaxID=71465 RepID=A0A3P7MGM6_CYLGO|nr:unnamed protein product [Cylicostephanus goldi]